MATTSRARRESQVTATVPSTTLWWMRCQGPWQPAAFPIEEGIAANLDTARTSSQRKWGACPMGRNGCSRRSSLTRSSTHATLSQPTQDAERPYWENAASPTTKCSREAAAAAPMSQRPSNKGQQSMDANDVGQVTTRRERGNWTGRYQATNQMRRDHLRNNLSPTAITAESSYQWLVPSSRCRRMPTPSPTSVPLSKQTDTAPTTDPNRQRSEACFGSASTAPGG